MQAQVRSDQYMSSAAVQQLEHSPFKTTQQQTTYKPAGAARAVAKPIELTRVFPGGGVAKATTTWRQIQGI